MNTLDFSDQSEFRIYGVFNPRRIAGAITLRSFYDHRPNANRGELRNEAARVVGLVDYSIAGAEQIHGSDIAVVVEGGSLSGVDGLVTNQQGLVLSILVADCLPVYLWNTRCDCVALLHAGWRGTSQGVVLNGIKCLRDNFGTEPEEIETLLGPCICQSCYEVGPEVAERFDAVYLRRTGGDRYLLDIREAVKKQLILAGVRTGAIRSDVSCTRCQPGLFHSYRRDAANAGRMVAVVTLLRD